MITDAQLRLSNAQTVALVASTVLSTNNVDLLSANRNLGRGQPMRLLVVVETTLTGGTSIQPVYIQSANADMSSPDVLLSGPVTAEAAAVAGAKLWDVQLPDNTKRYVGVRYVLVGDRSAGTGKVSAFLLSDTDANPYVPSVTGL